jgi:hypothetical protein
LAPDIGRFAYYTGLLIDTGLVMKKVEPPTWRPVVERAWRATLEVIFDDI